MLAAGTLSLNLATSAAGAPGSGRRFKSPVPMPELPDSLPDKASFPDIKGVYLNSAGFHPTSEGSKALVQMTCAGGDSGTAVFNPDPDRVRNKFADLINADPDEIVYVPSTQAGESFICSALGLPDKNSHVVTDELHFVGSHMMYTDMQKRGQSVTWVGMKDGRIPLNDIDRAIIKGKTHLVSVSSTSMVNGFRYDLKRLCEIAHAKGALVHLDAIQTVGNSPIDVKECGVDSLCAATYKWLMSPGTAFLYVKKSALERMKPPFYHHSMYDYPGDRYIPETHLYPYDDPGESVVSEYWPEKGAAGMFSMGYLPDAATLAGLEYSLSYIRNLGVENIERHAISLIEQLKEGVASCGFETLTPEDNVSPIFSLAIKNAERFAPAFESENIKITTRWNHIRIAVSVFNDSADIEKLLSVLRNLKK